jgi:cysteine-rich repeat protein
MPRLAKPEHLSAARRPPCAALALWLLLLLGVPAAHAASPVPKQLAVQGMLSSPGGAPAADGAYGMKIRLYASEDPAAPPLYTEVFAGVQVAGGQFATRLGTGDNGATLPLALFAEHGALWVGVSVGNDPELPRQRIDPQPFALRAATADSALSAELATSALVAQSLQCTGCVGVDQLSELALSAQNHAALYLGQKTTTQTALSGLSSRLDAIEPALANDGQGTVTLGDAQGQCGVAVGDVCHQGFPGKIVVTVPDGVAMQQVQGDGVVVFRKDEGKYYGQTPLGWRAFRFAPACGDGFVEPPEACDDGLGNADEKDKCRTNCTLPTCGDGITDSGEQCDDGNNDDTDACVLDCKTAACGDGFVQAGLEECDDGNNDDTDACVQGCKTATCGDGFVQAGVEQCDDGGVVPGDGCDGQCQSEKKDALVPGDTSVVVEKDGMEVRCMSWNGDVCEDAQIRVLAATCNAYNYKDLWHTNVYGNSSEQRNCPNWCALATNGNTSWSTCATSNNGQVPGSYRACAMSTNTQCTSGVYTWKTNYPGQDGKLHIYMGGCYPGYPKLRVQCSGW